MAHKGEEVTVEQIQKALRNIKSNRSPGPGGLLIKLVEDLL